jgi:hypothetical protein
LLPETTLFLGGDPLYPLRRRYLHSIIAQLVTSNIGPYRRYRSTGRIRSVTMIFINIRVVTTLLYRVLRCPWDNTAGAGRLSGNAAKESKESEEHGQPLASCGSPSDSGGAWMDRVAGNR